MAKEKEIREVFIRDVLLSTGDFTPEAVIRIGSEEYYESSPLGLTVGYKETQNEDISSYERNTLLHISDNLLVKDQKGFDKEVAALFESQISTALSLAYLKLEAARSKYNSDSLYEFISSKYSGRSNSPRIICNILNGGKHAQNNLTFCEFMIIPIGDETGSLIKIASEVYSDLRDIIISELGEEGLFIGREGGFAPDIPNVEYALRMIQEAIDTRHSGSCNIAVDVAANNFSSKNSNGEYIYSVNGKDYRSNELIDYYIKILDEFPSINYLEDLFHEDDVDAWRKAMTLFGEKVMIVADDLVVSQIENIIKYKGCFNTCILKVNQAGTFSGIIESYNYCIENGISTIISQRSGETDSCIISHIAAGLGSDYLKAGAPARERIVKYNELLRIYSI